MNTTIDTAPPARRTGASLPSVTVPIAAAVVILLGATLFAALAARGGWVADDLDFLVAGHQNTLTIDYLAHPVNDHLMPGLRLAYWLFAHVGGLMYGFTIAIRFALLVIAGAAMYRLLVLLLGRRPVVIAFLAVYCFIPLTLPSDLSLSSAVNLLPTHIGGILVIDAAVRYAATRRLRYAAAAAVWVLVGLSFWEKSAVVVVTAAVVVIGFVLTGTWPQRVIGALRLWPMWGVIGVVGAVFGAAWVRTRDVAEITERELGSWSDVADIARVAWLDSVGTTMIGGPWRWYVSENVYVSIADPPLAAVVSGQLAILTLIVVGARRTGLRATLTAWSAVVCYVLFTAVLLGIGRSDVFGIVPALHFHYWSDLAVTITVVLACSLMPIEHARIIDRATTPAASRHRRETRRVAWTGVRHPRLAVLGVVALAASVTVTATSFAARWDDNPAADYLENLHGDLASRPGTAMFDSVIDDAVLPPNAEYRAVSGVVAMMPDVDAVFDDGNAGYMAAPDGHVVAATLEPEATLGTASDHCRYLLHGTGHTVVPLSEPVNSGAWFIRIGYLANPEADVTVSVALGAGKATPLPQTPPWPAGIARSLIQTPDVPAFDRVIVTGSDEGVNMCIGDVTVGLPLLRGETS